MIIRSTYRYHKIDYNTSIISSAKHMHYEPAKLADWYPAFLSS